MQIHTIRPNLYAIRLKVRDGFSQLAHPQYNSDLIDYDYMVMTVARTVSKRSSSYDENATHSFILDLIYLELKQKKSLGIQCLCFSN